MSELHEVGDRLFAYVQREGVGGWGWSNAGLVVDADETLLVDTLFDLDLTDEMLRTMRGAVPAARRIGSLVNTHANGDHCYGNERVGGARIIASERAATEMRETPPALLAALKENAAQLGEAGEFFAEIFGPFAFAGIQATPPTETFTGELTLHVGDREVQLIEVGPAHTRGDVIVFLPADRVVFTGDVVFNGMHPVAWADVDGWRRALDVIEDLAPDVIVPGHGPVADLGAVREERDYWAWLRAEARERFERGMGPLAAARDLPDDHRWRAWGERERLAVNVSTLFRDWAGEQDAADPLELFGLMAAFARG